MVDGGNNYATFMVFDKDMLKLSKQTAATLLDDEVSISYHPPSVQTSTITQTYSVSQVNRGLRNNFPQCLEELRGRDFVYQVLVTPYNFTTNTRTFTVSGISNICNNENFMINANKTVSVEYREASTSTSATNTATTELKEGGSNNSSE
ncbi:Uncharacterized protein Rs2_09982 [Raphanus sativus]|nr:Uncharacterized protein Rs2_09982 [Raphanus sativus]